MIPYFMFMFSRPCFTTIVTRAARTPAALKMRKALQRFFSTHPRLPPPSEHKVKVFSEDIMPARCGLVIKGLKAGYHLRSVFLPDVFLVP